MSHETQVIEHESTKLAGHPLTIDQSPRVLQADKLIELAITQNADMDRLEKLLDLKERYEKEEARKAYTRAMAAFKSEGVVIQKDRIVTFPHKQDGGETTYTHASLGNIIKAATPYLAKHGLSHRWDVVRDGDRVLVSCVMTHQDGHSESTDPWPGPLDGSGKKNAIQQASSTVTYLQRYTFLAITGLAVKEMDDDGALGAAPQQRAAEEIIGDDEINTIDALLTDNDLDKGIFLKWLEKNIGVGSIPQIPMDRYNAVVAQLQSSIKNKGKKP